MEKGVAGGGSLITTFSTLAGSIEFAFTVVGVSASLTFEPIRPFRRGNHNRTCHREIVAETP